jgi:pimeloyl-ACP methyl ester carboxylesterase
VIPGWLAGDASTRALRWFVRDRGYHAHAWRLGMNRGPTSEVVAGLTERLHELRARHGRKVSVIGWSLGGIYARELARRHPALVRQVITLASPFRDPSATTVSRLYRTGLIREPRTPDPDGEVRRRFARPSPCRAARSTRRRTASSLGGAASTIPAPSAKTSPSARVTAAWPTTREP